MKIDTYPLRARLFAAAAAALIAACGGGGGGDNDQGAGGNPPNPPPTGGTSELAGGWSGSGAPGESAQVFVLADGTAWTFAMGANNTPLDMYVGALVLSSGQLSSTGMHTFDYETLAAASASASGSYVVGSQMSFAITREGATASVPISVSAVPTTDYDPARAADLTAIAGAWNGRFTPTETGGVVVTPAGAINTATSAGCLSSGVVTPRANENVFDVSVTLVATGSCLTPNAVATGTAFVVGSGANARLYLGLKTATGSQGATFVGTP
jgi:hypothetical protein